MYAENYNSHNNQHIHQSSNVIVEHERQVIDRMKTDKNLNARKRWKILARAICKNSIDESIEDPIQPNDNITDSERLCHGKQSICSSTDDDIDNIVSIRRFNEFNLIKKTQNKRNGETKHYEYRINQNDIEFIVNVRHINRILTANDLIGFNNTGNICVWPSEETLSYYLLANIQQFENKWVLELGGGMTCLAGLIVAKFGHPYAVHLTDGNLLAVQNVQEILKLNELNKCFVKTSVLDWVNMNHRLDQERERYDYVLAADCLFFDEVRDALVDTIWYYLANDGVAFIMAPQRGHTLEQFVGQSYERGFDCEVIHCYNETIWQRHQELLSTDFYDSNIHYPLLIKLTKQHQ